MMDILFVFATVGFSRSGSPTLLGAKSLSKEAFKYAR